MMDRPLLYSSLLSYFTLINKYRFHNHHLSSLVPWEALNTYLACLALWILQYNKLNCITCFLPSCPAICLGSCSCSSFCSAIYIASAIFCLLLFIPFSPFLILSISSVSDLFFFFAPLLLTPDYLLYHIYSNFPDLPYLSCPSEQTVLHSLIFVKSLLLFTPKQIPFVKSLLLESMIRPCSMVIHPRSLTLLVMLRCIYILIELVSLMIPARYASCVRSLLAMLLLGLFHT